MQEELLESESGNDEQYKNESEKISETKYGKYTVRSVFAGNHSITELMINYIDRKSSLRFDKTV